MRPRWRSLDTIAPAVAFVGFVGGTPDPAFARPRPPATAASAPRVPAGGGPTQPRYRQCARGFRWWCCIPADETCTRSGPARLLLLSVGGLAVAGGVTSLFALGDSLGGDDPATLLLATGTVALAGAIAGAIAGRLGADRGAVPDRVRTETLGVTTGWGGTSVLDEHRPPSMLGHFAPTLRFSDGNSRLRLTGYVGGPLGRQTDVDPRPQVAMAASDRDGTAPTVRRQRGVWAGIGLDMAVALPYPVLSPRRSRFLGRAELRWKPDFHYRREFVEPGEHGERMAERAMLLPLTVGMRWHVSPRQRFTFYLGPRFDIVSIRGPGDAALRRGKAELGPMYAEVWYDIDIPLNSWPRIDGRPRRAVVNSQLSFAYIHSRFDGLGINFRAVVGFLGPAYVRWYIRIRPKHADVAVQATVGARIGGGFGLFGTVGLVLPDLRAKVRHGRFRR